MKDIGEILWGVAIGGAIALIASLVSPESVGNAVIILFAQAMVYEVVW